jgi:hypothetical protein
VRADTRGEFERPGQGIDADLVRGLRQGSAPLIDELVRSPLTVTDAAVAEVSRYELTGPLWQSLTRGVHAWHDLRGTEPDVRIGVARLLLPDHGAVGGWAALRVLGVKVLEGDRGPHLSPQDVLLCVGTRGGIRVRPGYALSRWALPQEDVLEHRGIPVTIAERSCVEIMCREGVEEGLVAADAACAAGITSVDRLASYVEAHPRRPGIGRARLATGLVDPRSASMPETRLRFVWVVQAGLARPLVNRVVTDPSGFVAGAADLLDIEAGLVGEYDGAHHRELRQHTADNVREEGFERLNLTVVRATSIDLWPRRAALVDRILDGRRRGLARDRTREAWLLRT